MGVYADRPGDFQAWIDRNLDRLKFRFGDFPAEVFELSHGHGPCNHYPRAFMGAYLEARFHQAVKAARRLGMAVKLYPRHEITDVRIVGGMARLNINRPHSGGRTEMLLMPSFWRPVTGFPTAARKTILTHPGQQKSFWNASRQGVNLPSSAPVSVRSKQS
jgi:hypothetical protein